MQLARVIGTVVASVKDPSLQNCKILMIQPLTDTLKPSGAPLAAIDSVQAGPGDLVHWVTAREACYVLSDPFSPIDAAITGIVDGVDTQEVEIQDREKIFK